MTIAQNWEELGHTIFSTNSYETPTEIQQDNKAYWFRCLLFESASNQIVVSSVGPGTSRSAHKPTGLLTD